MGRILAECVKENEHSGKEGAGYTQRWLGERLGYSNPKTAETAPNKIMKGEQSLTLKQLEACIDIFQQPADHFIPIADDGGPKEDKIKALRNKKDLDRIKDALDALDKNVKDQILRMTRIFINVYAARSRNGRVGKKESLSDRLRRLRDDNKLSLDRLAHQTGYSKSCIYRYEEGESVPPLYFLYKCSRVYSVSVEYLLHDIIYGVPEELREDFMGLDHVFQDFLLEVMTETLKIYSRTAE